MSTDTAFHPVTSNDDIQKVLAQVDDTPVALEDPEITLPVDTEFDLPGGYISPVGEISLDAEVRELTGRDEELIAKATTSVKAMDVVLSRGLVSVGGNAPDEILRNNLLAGDRDYILMRIYAATFGSDLELGRYCPTCQSDVTVHVDLIEDVPVKRLESPMERRFTLDCSVGPVDVELPTGHTQKAMMAADNKNIAELATLLLENTVLSINGNSSLGKASVLDLSIRDRRKISDAIAERNPGPRMQDTVVPCPNCETELEVPLTVGALFQFR